MSEKGIHQDRLKMRFLKPEGKISRRELLKLIIPSYEVIPFVESTLCRGRQECGLCLDTCPLQAIKSENDGVAIDTALCSGCGVCIAACPYRAIIYPTFSLERLDQEMERLLTAEGALVEPGIMAFICQNCLPVPGEDGVEQVTYPAGVLPLRLPCLAMASSWLLLRAFDRGASGLALIFSQTKCPVGFDSARWQGSVRFIQALLSCWAIESERIRVFDVADDSANLARQLSQFAQEIAGLEAIPLKVSEPILLPAAGLLLPVLIRGLRDKLEGSSEGVVTTGLVPFAKLRLDGSRCIGCGLCVRDCSVEALTALSNEGTGDYQLLFRHDLCLACGKCIEICPEKCLQLERILELDKMDSPAKVLFEDRIVRCRECGSSIGPRAMINGLRSKLVAMGDSLTSQLELCPACKVKIMFGTERAIPGPVDKPD